MKDDISYFDNLDFEYFKNFFLKNNIRDYVFFIISKSGDTFETLALLNLLIIEGKKIKDYNIFDSMVIITENKNLTISKSLHKERHVIEKMNRKTKRYK